MIITICYYDFDCYFLLLHKRENCEYTTCIEGFLITNNYNDNNHFEFDKEYFGESNSVVCDVKNEGKQR